MQKPSNIFGRLGNQMFQMAFLVAYAKDHDTDIYLQDEYYFKDHEKLIRALYSSDIPDRTDAVAIHVRRGDYVNNPFYVDLYTDGYYKRAMKKFPNENFLVFSDDLEWCKQQPIFKNCQFFHGNEIEDMNKMASCKAHIIANSSFSWWGAWLHPTYPANKVIVPKNWFTDGVERTVLPKHWKKL